MSSRKILTNNLINKNNQNNKEEKNITNYKYQRKNNNDISNSKKENKQIKSFPLKNNETHRIILQEEDNYNYEIYNKPISSFKTYLLKSNIDKKYNTISTFNSFQLKYKNNPLFNRIKKNKGKNEFQNFNFMEVNSDLNLSFEANIKNNKEPKLIYKNKTNFEKIIRIFDKNHKIINNKNILNKYKNINIVSRYIKYNKNKKISKFSKKNKNTELRKNSNNITDSFKRNDSEGFNELYKRKNKMNEINIIQSTDKRYDKYKKDEQMDFEKNSIKSVARNLFNKNSSDNQSTSSKSNQFNKNYDLYDRDKKFRTQNIYIGLNKKIESKNNEVIDIKDNIINKNCNLNNNSNIKYKNSNRKSKSIIEENINKNNIENHNLEKNYSKYLYTKINIFNKDKKEEENSKENKPCFNFKNKYMSNKVEQNDINKNKNITDKIYLKKNNIQNSQRNIRKENNSNISLISSNKNDINISINNKGRNIPISINNKNVIRFEKNNNKNLTNNNSRKNSIDKKNRNEKTKIKLEKSEFHSPQMSSGNLLFKSNNLNTNKSVNNIIQIIDSTRPINNKILLNNKDQKNIKTSLARNRSLIVKEEINDNQDGKEKANYNIIIFNKKAQNRKNINDIKPKMNLDLSDKDKDVKIQKQIISKKELLNRNEEEKLNTHNNTTNQISYKIMNIIKYNKDEKNSLTSTHISNDTNKIENKNMNTIDNNKIYIFESQHTNKFQRSNHKYHEIKSTSSDKNAKFKEKDIKIQEKIKNKEPQMVYSTSMDNIRRRRNKYKEKEENVHTDQIKKKT